MYDTVNRCSRHAERAYCTRRLNVDQGKALSYEVLRFTTGNPGEPFWNSCVYVMCIEAISDDCQGRSGDTAYGCLMRFSSF